jgi:hypothetical protein
MPWWAACYQRAAGRGNPASLADARQSAVAPARQGPREGRGGGSRAPKEEALTWAYLTIEVCDATHCHTPRRFTQVSVQA